MRFFSVALFQSAFEASAPIQDHSSAKQVEMAAEVCQITFANVMKLKTPYNTYCEAHKAVHMKRYPDDEFCLNPQAPWFNEESSFVSEELHSCLNPADWRQHTKPNWIKTTLATEQETKPVAWWNHALKASITHSVDDLLKW